MIALKIILLVSLLAGHVIGLNDLLYAQSIHKETNLTNHPASDRYASYSPDDRLIVFESDRHGNWDLFMLELSTKTLTQLTRGQEDERSPSWHPTGGKIIHDGRKLVITGFREGNYEIIEVV